MNKNMTLDKVKVFALLHFVNSLCVVAMIGDQFEQGQVEDEDYIQQELISEQGQDIGQELMDEQDVDQEDEIGQGNPCIVALF
jgi:hypothetical protein